MRIEFHKNPKKEITYCLAKADDPVADGINPLIASGLVERGYLSEDEIYRPVLMRSQSKPHGSDTYDSRTGDEIARDKVLVRYYTAVGKANDAYIEALEKELAAIKGRRKFIGQKVANAEERLKRFEE